MKRILLLALLSLSACDPGESAQVAKNKGVPTLDSEGDCSRAWSLMQDIQKKSYGGYPKFKERCYASDWVGLCKDKTISMSDDLSKLCGNEDNADQLLKIVDG